MVHASAQVTLTADKSCDVVMAEMKARIAGQPGAWHDPHNNGQYALDASDDPSELHMHRVTGDKKYTDKQLFTFTNSPGQCEITGCSESQVFSVADFSTNYCDLRMMYCGKADGCKPVTTAGQEITIHETKVTPSVGAGKDPEACLKTSKLIGAGTRSLTQELFQV